MELTAINGDDPRIGHFFALARLANATYWSMDLTDTFVTPVSAVGSTNLLFEETCFYGTDYRSYEEMLDWVFENTDFSSKTALEMWVAVQAKLVSRTR